MAFHLLSEPIRRYVHEQRWAQLRPIQAAAIEKIMSSDNNYILASRTASGKTEAAFLPILSKVNFNDPGVQVLYISPLIALINDQFSRIEALCKYLNVTITRWHGEANRTKKEQLIQDPNGIVLITPESIEAMLVNKPYNVKHLFSHLRYIVIDEIHSFIGTDRGTQLKSILSRVREVHPATYSIIGLSATIGDYEEAKKFTGDSANTTVLLDRRPGETEVIFRYFDSDGPELPLSLLKDLYRETKDNRVLIFPNSRGRAEEVAVKLKKIAARVNGHGHYFSHHSSVDKNAREYVEHFAKHSRNQPFCIACTSTLELGIDIGNIDEVVQIDATHGIAALIQRVGRSGRKEGQAGKLLLYSTNSWSLLQSVACWLLYRQGYIEPPERMEKSYDILLHQALSIVTSHAGITYDLLHQQLQRNAAFHSISSEHLREIVEHLIVTGLVELLGEELIIGIDGERIVNNREFYSVFITEENFKVVHVANTIGEIPFSSQLIEGESILLSANIWKIIYVDKRARKIKVVPSGDGRKPQFSGGSALIHSSIREKMAEVLFSCQHYDFLDPASTTALRELRNEFAAFAITDLAYQRPVLAGEKECRLYSFAGTRVNRTLQLLFSITGIKSVLDDATSSFFISTSFNELHASWSLLLKPLSHIDEHIAKQLRKNPALLYSSKWGSYLPERLQVVLLKEKYYAIDEAVEFLSRVKLIESYSQVKQPAGTANYNFDLLQR